MIYVVEIPHQRPAHGWMAYDEDEFINLLQERTDSVELTDFEDAVVFLRSDLSNCEVYSTLDQARDALTDDWRWDGHQGARARAELERLIEESGE